MSQLCTQLYLSERLILVATQVHNIMYALSWSLIYTDAVCGLEDYGNESVLFKIRPNRILDYAQASMPILSRLSCIYVCVCVCTFLSYSAAGVSASFGEMLLLVAMYFHSNQLSSIIELVCSTLGMKVRWEGDLNQ